MCGGMADIQSAAAEIRRGKKEEGKNKPQHENIMVCPITQGDHKKAALLPHMDGSIVFATWHQCAPYLTHASLIPPHSSSIKASQLVQPFLHISWQRVLYFTIGCPFPPKIDPSHWGIWTTSNTWFLGPTRFHNPNGISISSAFLQSSQSWQTDRGMVCLSDRQTDQQTDHATPSITARRIYIVRRCCLKTESAGKLSEPRITQKLQLP